MQTTYVPVLSISFVNRRVRRFRKCLPMPRNRMGFFFHTIESEGTGERTVADKCVPGLLAAFSPIRSG